MKKDKATKICAFLLVAVLIATAVNFYTLNQNKKIAIEIEDINTVISTGVQRCKIRDQILSNIVVDVKNQEVVVYCLGDCRKVEEGISCDPMPPFAVKKIGNQTYVTRDVEI